jgi:hypothetical protein
LLGRSSASPSLVLSIVTYIPVFVAYWLLRRRKNGLMGHQENRASEKDLGEEEKVPWEY